MLLAAAPFATASAQQADAASAAAPTAAQAAAPEADDAQVGRLMEAMHMRQSLDAMLPELEAAQKQIVERALADKTLTEAQRGRIDEFMARMQQHVREVMSWERVEPLYRDVYKKTFSAAEMEAMIAFYGSAEGQSVVAKMPELMRHTMEATQSLMTPVLAQLQRDVAELTGGD